MVEGFFQEHGPPEEAMGTWPHVVVVGGGFAGLKICHRPERQPVRVTRVDQRNCNLFQPQLDLVASGLVSKANGASPLLQMVGTVANIWILLCEVVDIDPKSSSLALNG